MTFIVCGVLLKKDGKYLLVQEKQPKVYGKWNLPGGKVDKGESLEQAAVREAKEESGFVIELEKHLLTLHLATERPVMHAFQAKIIGGQLKFPEDEILDAKWFTYKEIIGIKDDLRNPEYILGAIESAK